MSSHERQTGYERDKEVQNEISRGFTGVLLVLALACASQVMQCIDSQGQPLSVEKHGEATRP